MTRKTIITAITVAAAMAAPTVFATNAAADDCANPSVEVAATPTVSTVGTPVNYNYSFCYNTNGDDYTVQVLSETPSSTGSGYVSGAASPLATMSLAAQPGTLSGSGVFTPTTAGRYEVVVAYYMQGQIQWEDEGQTVFIANAPAAVVTPPTPTPTPTPVLAPVPALAPAPTPLTPVGAVAPEAVLSLVKRADVKRTRAGADVGYTLIVRNRSVSTADDVEVCDTLPANTLYVGASRKAAFSGDRACFDVGALASSATASIHLTLKLAANAHGLIVNHAQASAANAVAVSAKATVAVKAAPTIFVSAPVTG